MTVIIDPNAKKQSVRINLNGDIIDENKNVLVPNTVEEVDPETIKRAISNAHEKQEEKDEQLENPLDIQKEIENTEKRLEELKALKKEKIALLKKQLEALEE